MATTTQRPKFSPKADPSYTVRNRPPSTEHRTEPPVGAATVDQASTVQREPVPEITPRSPGFGERLPDLLRSARTYFVPPKLLADPPPSVSELSSYARRGSWTTSTGPLRRLGVLWLVVIAIPATAVCRYLEWILQRPGRALVVGALWLLFIKTGGGPWIADNLIRPLIDVAATVLL